VTFDEWMQYVVIAFEVAGVAVLVIGSILALVRAAIALRGGGRISYQLLRQGIGRSVLLGLEILIIADIVQTITIDPSVESALALALIVLVRIVLSFSLEVELEGMLPWRRAKQPEDSPPTSADPTT
jgi:uncharacterized membrane protein